MASPYFVGKMIDAINLDKSEVKLDQVTLYLLIIYLAGSVCTFFRSMIFNYAGERVVVSIDLSIKIAVSQELI